VTALATRESVAGLVIFSIVFLMRLKKDLQAFQKVENMTSYSIGDVD
jgi:hypothetical protein